MCGRFTQTAPWEKVKKEFAVRGEPAADKKLFQPRYNIAPMQIVPVVRDAASDRQISTFKWGLVPSWSKNAEIGNRMINARAETITEKPSFREAFRNRRCIIPASGFYEWQKTEKGAKQPFYFYLKEREVFGFAGLWEEWIDKESGELLETCTIITTEANEVLKPVHDRMPVILKPEDYDQWLDLKEKNTDKLQKLLVPYIAKEMDLHPVSRSVNVITTNNAELIAPINSL
ncbi:MAG TPA: SOS response-associated peptidase [Pyrinomonadaceae bacterium]|jgi:putative SOS response-associated peptidase YedK